MSKLTPEKREELALLLPWFANGTLDEAESKRVQDALESDSELQAQFDLILEDQAAAIDLVADEEVPLSMNERFRIALDAAPSAEEEETMARAKREARPGFFANLMSNLFPTRTFAYAAVAAALVVVAQSGAIISLLGQGSQGTQYQTASGGEEVSAQATGLLVQFNSEASLAELGQFLQENNGQIVEGPTADGLFKLKFELNEGVTSAEILATAESNSKLFLFVLPNG